MTEIAARLTRPIRRLDRRAFLGLSLALVVAVAGALVLLRALQLRDAVLPGVRVAGVEVGGLPRADAEAHVAKTLSRRLARPVSVTVGGRSFTIKPATLYRLDAGATAAGAFAAGRESVWRRLGAAVAPFAFERDVAPVLTPTKNGSRRLAAKIDSVTRRAVAARVSMEGVEPVVRPGRAGTVVDGEAVAAAVLAAGLAGTASVQAATERVVPELSTEEARAAAARAQTVVSAPVSVALAGERLGVLEPADLGPLVRFQPYRGAYELVLDRHALAERLEPLVASRTRAPVDASFEVVGERVRVLPSQGGTRLAVRKAAVAVLAAALTGGERSTALALTKREAGLTTREARALGIREQVSTFTTDMGESSPNRIWNVQLLGKYLDGTILRPGQQFSFDAVLGPRTPERGFREGQMIFAGVLIPSIGGGVCQTATTIFNAAFEAGLPVQERNNHSFYISHYPVGRDATVSWGGPDLVFTNDLGNSLLIRASWTDETFTVSFYGTEQNRRVESTTSEPTNYTQPALQYAIDPTAPPGSVRTTGGGGPGFEVNVHRRVFEDGKLLREDDFFTRYTPENPTQVYGPGGDPPGPYFVLPTSG
jgi:vancomycin resistance protein YoaR